MGGELDPEDHGDGGGQLTDVVIPGPELSLHVSKPSLVLLPTAGEVDLGPG